MMDADDDRALKVRPARTGDAPAIAGVLVAGWRSAYAGLLPAEHLAGMSIRRHAAQQQAIIAAGGGVLVAESRDRVVGFCTVGAARTNRVGTKGLGTNGLAEGEVETLYVLDDWRERGLGRRLMQSGAAYLAGRGCRSLFLWVLEDNPSRWFYERLGGRRTLRSTTYVAGRPFQQTAYVWDPIELLTEGVAKL